MHRPNEEQYEERVTQLSCKCTPRPIPWKSLPRKWGGPRSMFTLVCVLPILSRTRSRPSTTPSFSVAHAFEIARLQPDGQRRALLGCFLDHRTTAAILKDAKVEAVTVPQLRAWIEREIHLNLANAPFDPQGPVASRGKLREMPETHWKQPSPLPGSEPEIHVLVK
jgi:hypothetical protein